MEQSAEIGESIDPGDLEIRERIKFPRNVGIQPVGITHNQEFWEENKKPIAQVINKNDFVVSEIDPFGINFLSGYNEFFKGLVKESWKQEKPILYVDPLTWKQSAVEGVQLLAGTGLVLYNGVKLMINHYHSRMTRRKFMKGSLGLIAGLGLAGSTTGPQAFLDEIVSVAGKTQEANFLDNPLMLSDYREAGMALGLQTASQRNSSWSGSFFYRRRSYSRVRTLLTKHGRCEESI